MRERLADAYSVDFMERLFDAFPDADGGDDGDSDVATALTGLLGVMPKSHAEDLQQVCGGASGGGVGVKRVCLPHSAHAPLTSTCLVVAAPAEHVG